MDTVILARTGYAGRSIFYCSFFPRFLTSQLNHSSHTNTLARVHTRGKLQSTRAEPGRKGGMMRPKAGVCLYFLSRKKNQAMWLRVFFSTSPAYSPFLTSIRSTVWFRCSPTHTLTHTHGLLCVCCMCPFTFFSIISDLFFGFASFATRFSLPSSLCVCGWGKRRLGGWTGLRRFREENFHSPWEHLWPIFTTIQHTETLREQEREKHCTHTQVTLAHSNFVLLFFSCGWGCIFFFTKHESRTELLLGDWSFIHPKTCCYIAKKTEQNRNYSPASSVTAATKNNRSFFTIDVWWRHTHTSLFLKNLYFFPFNYWQYKTLLRLKS